MNKTELIAVMASKSGLTKEASAKALAAFTDAIGDALADKEKVSIVGFGSFEAKERAERDGRNPQTGEIVKIPACVAASFKAGKELKARINND